MALWAEKNGVLIPHHFGYDAVEETNAKRRRPARTSTSMEDDELPDYRRRKLIATSRDIPRNFSIAGWAIRKHLDYVSTFSFQSRTPDLQFNQRLEDLFLWWSRAKNCDVAGRHSLTKFIRMVEQSRTVDGDVLVVMLQQGYLQGIEADRITSPMQTSSENYVNGVEIDEYGRAIRYAVSRRTPGSSVLTFDKWVSAENARLVGYFDRFDQVRGISRLASAINAYQDLYEGITYALAKAKVTQMFGLITYRDTTDPLASLTQSTMDDGETPRYEIEFGKGPFHLDLDDGDRAEVLESKTPPVEFQQFIQLTIAQAIKSLDIPFSFYDESFTNYSGARQALLQYEQSVQAKRDDLVELLDQITAWKIGQWVAAGLIDLPRGVRSAAEIDWAWVPAGIPWIDPLKEVQADVLAVKNRIKSRQQIAKERGQDFYSTVDQLAAEEAYMEMLGIPIELAATPSTPPPEKEAPEEEAEEPDEEEADDAVSE